MCCGYPDELHRKTRAYGSILIELFPFVTLEKVFWFLLILLNYLRNLFIFCRNVDIDKMLLLEKNKDLNSCRIVGHLI